MLDDLGARDELLDLAQELEAVALSDDYFLSRKLYPNVDFYSGLIYQAMGFPPNMFTVLFALGRLPGWIAHWREMITDPATKIGRPRQVYTGPTHATTCRWPTADESAVHVEPSSSTLVVICDDSHERATAAHIEVLATQQDSWSTTPALPTYEDR